MRFLLHGVTGSGKTEIYIRAAQQVLEQGRNVIVLVPEIALTGQIIDRFIGRFGSGKVAVLHSKLSLGERYDQWKKCATGATETDRSSSEHVRQYLRPWKTSG